MSKRQRAKPEVEREARQRARFKCENCDKFTRNQFAHIIPDSEGGSVEVKNILWLCYECHGNFEAQGKSGVLREALLKNMQDIRDRPKADSLVDGIFDDLLAHPDQPINVILGNVGFVDLGRVFSEPLDSYRPAFLRFCRKDSRLMLEGHLKDIRGFTLIEFTEGYLHFYTGNVWEIERRARYLKLYSKSRRLWIELRQKEDLSIFIKGEIYAGGEIISISKRAGIRFPAGGGFSNLSLVGSNSTGAIGIMLSPSPIPRPYGHVSPNVQSD